MRCRSSQRGAALMLLLIIVLLATTYNFYSQLSATSQDSERQAKTSAALAQAKDALIGYAATYRDSHPNEGFGYLPCPDINNTGTAQLNCGDIGETMVGRLPYKELGLPDLRAADGECLWYIVSGSHKYNPKFAPLNWDTLGNIKVQDLNSSVLAAPNDSNGGAVAVIVAPGSPLLGKNRPPGTLNCSGDATNSITAYLDGDYAEATSGTLTVTAGQPKSSTNNDQLTWISARELFAPIAKRNDLLGTLLTQLTTCLNFTSYQHIPAVNKVAAGTKSVSNSAGIDEVKTVLGCTFDQPATTFWTNWKDHFQYAVCNSPSSTCLQVTIDGTVNSCSGVILFGGRMTNGNPRSAAEKLALSNYFDAGNTFTLTTATTTLKGNSAYKGSTPDSDIAICLQPAPAALSFQDGFGSLTPVAADFSGQSMISTDASAKILTLGSPGLTGNTTGEPSAKLFGCSWFGTTLPFGNGLRAYFRYEILNVGVGFVLALADADPSRNPSLGMCGRGDSSLGYSGLPNDGNAIPGFTVAPIRYPKIGLEIDTRQDFFSRNDPSSSHMASLFWGSPTVDDDDNIHGAPTIAVAGSPQNPTAVNRSIVRDANVGRHVRLEIVRTPNLGGHDYVIKAWVLSFLPPDFDVLSADFDEAIVPAQIHTSASIGDLSADKEALRNIWVGFTNAASATSDQQIQISSFAIRTTP